MRRVECLGAPTDAEVCASCDTEHFSWDVFLSIMVVGLLAPSAVPARGNTSHSKPPTITRKAAGKYAKAGTAKVNDYLRIPKHLDPGTDHERVVSEEIVSVKRWQADN